MSRTRSARLITAAGPVFNLDGLCAQTDPEAFFPEKGENAKDAKKICGLCDVRRECLEWALRTDERYGVWGGETELDRKKHRKAMLARS